MLWLTIYKKRALVYGQDKDFRYYFTGSSANNRKVNHGDSLGNLRYKI